MTAPAKSVPAPAAKASTPSPTPAAASPVPARAPASAPAPGGLERVRKITTKLFGKLAVGKENGIKLAGVIRSTTPREGNFGPYLAFKGDFRAISGDKTVMSNELIVPAYIESILSDGFLAAFNAIPKGVSANPEATFACLLYKKDDSANEKNARGFVWEIEEIRAMKGPDLANDHLLKLLA